MTDAQVRRFFEECGFEIMALAGLKCASPTLNAHLTEDELERALGEVDDPSVEALVQVGTNLSMARLAGAVEARLDEPVIAINTATYWWALRRNAIEDRIPGFGSPLEDH